MRPALYPVLFGSNYSQEARLLFASMTTPPTAARRALIDTTIKSLKSAGVWIKLDVLYVSAAADSQSARLNWKNPGTFDAIAVNSPAFVADRGYTGDGASSRLRTQYTPSTNGVNLTQDNASAWVWPLTDVAETINDIGNTTAPSIVLATRRATNVTSGTINDATTSSIANTSSIGFFGESRVDANTKRFWKNGAQLGADQAVASTGIAAQEQWICGANAVQFATKQIALSAWGASLSGLESSFYNSLLPYMQSVGAV